MIMYPFFVLAFLQGKCIKMIQLGIYTAQVYQKWVNKTPCQSTQKSNFVTATFLLHGACSAQNFVWLASVYSDFGSNGTSLETTICIVVPVPDTQNYGLLLFS